MSELGHATDCEKLEYAYRKANPGGGMWGDTVRDRCTCALAERRRIAELEAERAKLPEVGPPKRNGPALEWCGTTGIVWLHYERKTITASVARQTPAEARWLAAALLAAADEAEKSAPQTQKDPAGHLG